MRRFLLVSTLGAFALVAGACGGFGGGEESPAGSPPPPPVAAEPGGPSGVAAVFAAAGQKALEAGSARMAMNISFVSAELPGELTIAAEGVFDMRTQRGELALDMTSLTQLMGAQGAAISGLLPDRIVLDGETVYVRMPGLGQVMPDAKKWLRVDMNALAKQTGQDLSQFATVGQADPSQLLKLLEGIQGDVQDLGREKIRDATTTHYRVALDLKQLAGALPAAQQEGFQAQLDQMTQQLGLSSLPFDVWIGDDGLLRRMSLALDLSAAAQADGGTGPFSMSFVVDMFDYGVAVDVKPPAPGKTMDISELGGLAFGA